MEYRNRYGDYGYRRKTTKRTRHARRLPLVLLTLVLVALLGVGTTLAFLSTGTEKVQNIFTPGKVACEVTEVFDNNVKTDAAVKNTGNTEAYIRAAVVVTWVREDGSVCAQRPVEATDYTINFNTAEWAQGDDGYWYFKSPVAPQGSTKALIAECKPTEAPNAPTGCHLSVEIVASAIQASPASVVEGNWNVKVTGSEVTPQ